MLSQRKRTSFLAARAPWGESHGKILELEIKAFQLELVPKKCMADSGKCVGSRVKERSHASHLNIVPQTRIFHFRYNGIKGEPARGLP
jgi:hypothetical protein